MTYTPQTVLEFELDSRPERLKVVWGQKQIPVVVRKPEERLKVRLPYAKDNREWLRDDRRPKPKWITDKKYWELPKTWFNDFVDRALIKYGRLYVIQPYRSKETCAPACWNAFGHECECSCMGRHHGLGRMKGFIEITETFAVKWGKQELACRLMITKPLS